MVSWTKADAKVPISVSGFDVLVTRVGYALLEDREALLMPRENSYAAYLLRFRKMQDGALAPWAASVQSISTGEQRSFPSIEALATFLLAQFSGSLPESDLGCRGEARPDQKDA